MNMKTTDGFIRGSLHNRKYYHKGVNEIVIVLSAGKINLEYYNIFLENGRKLTEPLIVNTIISMIHSDFLIEINGLDKASLII